MFLEVGAMGVFAMIYLPLVVRVLCGVVLSSEFQMENIIFVACYI